MANVNTEMVVKLIIENCTFREKFDPLVTRKGVRYKGVVCSRGVTAASKHQEELVSGHGRVEKPWLGLQQRKSISKCHVIYLYDVLYLKNKYRSRC